MLIDPKSAIQAGLALLPPKMDTLPARVMLYAIGRQESRFKHRRQMGNGPATGFWQFERGGGVRGVLEHSASKGLALQVCGQEGVAPQAHPVWRALQSNDALAAAFARLLLYTDPRPLPAPELASADDAWAYYLRNWRPGRPHEATWPGFWREACAAYDCEVSP